MVEEGASMRHRGTLKDDRSVGRVEDCGGTVRSRRGRSGLGCFRGVGLGRLLAGRHVLRSLLDGLALKLKVV